MGRFQPIAWFAASLMLGTVWPCHSYSDEIDVELAKAKTARLRALEDAEEALQAELVALVRQLAELGDVDRLREATTESVKLRDEGILPQSEDAQKAVETYLATRRKVDSALYGRYRDYTAELEKSDPGRAKTLASEASKFVDIEKELFAAGRLRPKAGGEEGSAGSSSKTIGKTASEKHIFACNKLGEILGAFDAAVGAAEELDTTVRQQAAYREAFREAAGKISGMEFEICYRVDDASPGPAYYKRTDLTLSLDYRPRLSDQVPLAGKLTSLEVPLTPKQAEAVDNGDYLCLKGSLTLKDHSDYFRLVDEDIGPCGIFYRCPSNGLKYGIYMSVQDMRFLKSPPDYLVAEGEPEAEPTDDP